MHLLSAGAERGLGNSGKTGEERTDVSDKGTDAVDNGPCDPDALEPVPRLIHLVLVVGDLGADDGHGGHKAGQNRTDTRNLVIDINNNFVGYRPHIGYGSSGQDGHGKDQEHDKGEGIDTIELFQWVVLLKAKLKGTTPSSVIPFVL